MRRLALIWLITNVYWLISYTDELPDVRPLIWFYSIRSVVLLIALVYSFYRTTPSFYVPILYDLPEEQFWGMIFFVVISVRTFFIRHFVGNDYVPIIEVAFLAFAIFRLLLAFQRRDWIDIAEKAREKRIKSLQEKAKLSKSEMREMIPVFIELAKQNQRTPNSWRIVFFMLTIAFGALLDSVAASFVSNMLSVFGIDLTNILPPY